MTPGLAGAGLHGRAATALLHQAQLAHASQPAPDLVSAGGGAAPDAVPGVAQSAAVQPGPPGPAAIAAVEHAPQAASAGPSLPGTSPTAAAPRHETARGEAAFGDPGDAPVVVTARPLQSGAAHSLRDQLAGYVRSLVASTQDQYKAMQQVAAQPITAPDVPGGVEFVAMSQRMMKLQVMSLDYQLEMGAAEQVRSTGKAVMDKFTEMKD